MPSTSDNPVTPFRRAGRWLLVLAWAGVIFAASHRPNLRVTDDDLLDLVLRKGAHIGVYAVLAVLLIHALHASVEWRWRRMQIVTWASTLAYAISDEWHQTFVDGRVGHATDVLIDMIGASAALLVLSLRRPNPARSTLP